MKLTFNGLDMNLGSLSRLSNSDWVRHQGVIQRSPAR